jgi:hypothetical protein
MSEATWYVSLCAWLTLFNVKFSKFMHVRLKMEEMSLKMRMWWHLEVRDSSQLTANK